MAISYNAGTNTLTLDGVNTYTLLDIYNANVAGAWGVVTHVGEMYLFMCHMVVGDAVGNATKLIDNNVGFQIGVSGTLKAFYTNAGSSFEMTGCLLKFHYSQGGFDRPLGSWKFENCSIYLNGNMYCLANQTHKRSEFKGAIWYHKVGVCSYFKCLTDVSHRVYYYTTGDIDDWTIIGTGAGYLRIAYQSPTIKNSNITVPVKIEWDNIHAIFINTTFTEGDLVMNFAVNYLLDKWGFNLLVTDTNNNSLVASVTLRDKNGDIKHSAVTGADGKLPATWEVLANRYDGTSETKTEYNPFTLTVTKTGYEDYETEITIDHIVKNDQVVLIKKKRRGKLRLC